MREDINPKVLALLLITSVLFVSIIATRVNLNRSDSAPTHSGADAQAPSREWQERAEPVLETWKSQDFVVITNTPEFSREIRSISLIDDGPALDGNQKEKLFQCAENLLFAYHAGDFDSYRRFRAPVDQFEFFEYSADHLRTMFPDVTDSPADLLKHYWLWAHGGRFGGSYVGFWKGVSIKESRIRLIHSKSLHEGLRSMIPKTEENIGTMTSAPAFHFLVSPEDLLSRLGEITYAIVKVLPSNEDVIYPVYCLYYWVPQDSEWLPLELSAAYSGPRTKTIIF